MVKKLAPILAAVVVTQMRYAASITLVNSTVMPHVRIV